MNYPRCTRCCGVDSACGGGPGAGVDGHRRRRHLQLEREQVDGDQHGSAMTGPILRRRNSSRFARDEYAFLPVPDRVGYAAAHPRGGECAGGRHRRAFQQVRERWTIACLAG